MLIEGTQGVLHVRDSNLAESRLTSVNLADSMYDDVALQRTTFTKVSFAACRFENVNLSDAVVDDVNLQRTAFTNVNFAECTLENVNLSNVTIRDANLSNMTIDGVAVSLLMEVYAETVARRNAAPEA